MGKSKTFETAAINSFMPEPGQMQIFEEDLKEKEAAAIQAVQIPAGYEIRPQRKNQLIQAYTTQYVKDKIKEYADAEQMGLSEFINCLFAAYIEGREGKKKK